MGDILASGYWGAELCAFQPGDTAVVLGLGPVGLCAAECAALARIASLPDTDPLLPLAAQAYDEVERIIAKIPEAQ